MEKKAIFQETAPNQELPEVAVGHKVNASTVEKLVISAENVPKREELLLSETLVASTAVKKVISQKNVRMKRKSEAL